MVMVHSGLWSGLTRGMRKSWAITHPILIEYSDLEVVSEYR